MKEKKNTLGSQFKNRTETGDEPKRNWAKAEKPDNFQRFYGVEKGNRFVRRFKLYFRDGRVLSVPYAYLPLIVYDPGRDLDIKTGDLDIKIKGRGLHKLADWLSDEKVLWIRESASGIDDEDTEEFISQIDIEGELLP